MRDREASCATGLVELLLCLTGGFVVSLLCVSVGVLLNNVVESGTESLWLDMFVEGGIGFVEIDGNLDGRMDAMGVGPNHLAASDKRKKLGTWNGVVSPGGGLNRIRCLAGGLHGFPPPTSD